MCILLSTLELMFPNDLTFFSFTAKGCLIPYDPKSQNSSMMIPNGSSFNYTCYDGYNVNGTNTSVIELQCSLGNLTTNGQLFEENMKCVGKYLLYLNIHSLAKEKS